MRIGDDNLCCNCKEVRQGPSLSKLISGKDFMEKVLLGYK